MNCKDFFFWRRSGGVIYGLNGLGPDPHYNMTPQLQPHGEHPIERIHRELSSLFHRVSGSKSFYGSIWVYRMEWGGH